LPLFVSALNTIPENRPKPSAAQIELAGGANGICRA
jgi:hypothetical protein